jgi:hypothetical protein
VNAAIFYTDYEDIQLNFQEQASPVLRNAGTATLQGAEIEAQGSSPEASASPSRPATSMRSTTRSIRW